ncbi:MAG TPA: hypothetical protein VFG29_07860 [Syntrophales bacterium]|nr:hypothetical protein [Syntrophales bacterium]
MTVCLLSYPALAQSQTSGQAQQSDNKPGWYCPYCGGYGPGGMMGYGAGYGMRPGMMWG